jgi:hypothetical protein
MELVNWLSIYKANMRIFSQALNESAVPEDPEGDRDGQNNRLE